MRVGKTSSVTHQAAGGGELTQGIDCRHPTVRRQRNEFYAMVVEQRGGTDQERIGFCARLVRDRIDLVNGACVEEVDLLRYAEAAAGYLRQSA